MTPSSSSLRLFRKGPQFWAVKAFRVSGIMYFEDGRWQKFTKDVVAESEEQATEKVLSILGSKHRLKRRQIAIREVREIDPSESEDPVVRYHFGVSGRG